MLQLIAEAPLQVIAHLSAAVAAALFGAIIFFNRKGTRFHKTLGWSFVVAMTITAVSAVFIRRTEGIPNIAGFTPIHLFVVITAIGLPNAIIKIRQGNVRGHAGSMIGLYVGAIVIAGVLAFLPGRLMHALVFGR